LLDDDPDETGARCPECRAALYEKRSPVRVSTEAADGQCVTHPNSPAAGICHRCGNFFCTVCRSRWQRRVVCLACLERALQSRETTPQETRGHYLQALWSMICGIAAWGLMLLGIVLFFFGIRNGPDDPAIALLLPSVIFLAISPCCVVPGLGLGAAAIRTRGDHLVLATIGLVLSALMAGAIIGVVCLGAWRG
jgi:hypothetical protein